MHSLRFSMAWKAGVEVVGAEVAHRCPRLGEVGEEAEGKAEVEPESLKPLLIDSEGEVAATAVSLQSASAALEVAGAFWPKSAREPAEVASSAFRLLLA